MQSALPLRSHQGRGTSRRCRYAVEFAVAAAILAFVLACAVSAQGPKATAVEAPPAPPAFAPADSTRYLDTIKALTTPNMEGRGDDTQGINRAADLLQQRYKSAGLEPAGTNGFFQPFTVVTGAKLSGDNQVIQEISGDKQQLKLNQDFVPFSFSATGNATAQVVFAGYGATADEFNYDDFRGIDVKDKIVALLRYEPSGFAAKAGNQGLTRHSALITKAINARNHGAKAVVIINGKIGSGEEDVLTRFGSVSGPENAGILLLQVKNTIAQVWFQVAGKSLAAVQNQINSSGQPASFAFPSTLQLQLDVNIESTRATVKNVLAYLPGKPTST